LAAKVLTVAQSAPLFTTVDAGAPPAWTRANDRERLTTERDNKIEKARR
jgi:hypothetical protein